jgi:hypothetical protein
MPRKSALPALALALVLALAAPALAANPAHIHFLVTPPTPAPGLNPTQAVERFREGLLKLAGGYTEWGPTQGAARHGGGIHRENNFSYLVAADRDLTPELAALVKKCFSAPHPFVLHWTGTANIKLGK